MSGSLRALTMPKWGLEMTEGTLTEWLVGEGESFARGQGLAVIETEKIANEMEADRDGVMCRHVAAPGDTLPIGALLGVAGTGKAKDGEIDAFLKDFKAVDTGPSHDRGNDDKTVDEAPAPVKEKSGTIRPKPESSPKAVPEPAPKSVSEPEGDDSEIDASPKARARARHLGVSLKNVTGTGRGGRVTCQDVEQAARQQDKNTPSGHVSTVTRISPAAREMARLLDVDLDAMTGTGRGGRITLQDVEQAARAQGVSGEDVSAAAEAVRATPLARRIAEARGIPLGDIAGSGSRGRILRGDVDRARHKTPLAGDARYTGHKMTTMRRTIARRLVESKQTVPHFYLTIDVELDDLLSIRRQLNNRPDARKLSVNDFLIRASGLALIAEPDANVQLVDEEIRIFDRADISVAVAVDGGLVTPVIRGADIKGVDEISAEMAELAARARAGKLGMDEMQGGSFSLSNLGMYGIRQFDAVINPPQGSIMAVGKAEKRQIVRDDNSVDIRTCMTVTLSCDHRVIDGTIGARFLAAFKDLIENPARLIVSD